jgi:hypothetical protein
MGELAALFCIHIDGRESPAMSRHTDEQYRKAAYRLFQKDGELEVDDAAIVSVGSDDGAYVQAWVWVDNEAIILEDGDAA